jgi:hypothetical protein
MEYPEYARSYVYFRSGKFEFSDETDMNENKNPAVVSNLTQYFILRIRKLLNLLPFLNGY